jgi:beta-aspartyl-peptidase (threonine type)
LRIRHLALSVAFLNFITLSGFTQVAPDVTAVTLIHSACPGGCPAFSLKIDRSGIVRYDGKGFVKVFGQKTWSVPERAADAILDRLQTGGFVAGERAGRFLTDNGACATNPSEKQVGVVIEADGHEEMPIPSCFSPELEKIVEDASSLAGTSIYTTGHDPDREAAIKGVLEAQVTAWNKGDIDGFMRGYWMSKDLTFFSGGSETHGWSETLERYRKSYKGTGKQMGQLTFGDLRIEMLSPESAFVRGTWKLTMSDGKTPHGLFTLIFRKMPDGWRIIHDSTGAA